MREEGWYPNPNNYGQIEGTDCTIQRYWNGQDWTDDVRYRDNKRWISASRPLRAVPNN